MALSVVSSGRRSLVSTLSVNALSRRTKTIQKRLQVPIPDDVRRVILEYRNKTNSKDYEDLVCSLRDFPIEDAELSKLLQLLRKDIYLLNQSIHHLVNAILKIKWTHRCQRTVQDYQGFLVDLLSAHNYYTKIVFEELVSTFKLVEGQDDINISLEESEDMNNYVHEVFKILLHIIPMSCNLLKEIIEENFPYLRRCAEEHVFYLCNVLQIIDYQPTLSTDLLFLIIDKLILLDVNAPKHEIMGSEDAHKDELFEMDLDSNTSSMKHPIADTLDRLLEVFISYTRSTCYDKTSGSELKVDATKELFKEIMNVFDCLILPTHGTHHVQFIVFYMSNMKIQLADLFLTYLWQKVTSTRVANVIRQSAVAYFSGFLVRSKTVSIRVLTKNITEMCIWIHNYICKQEDIDCTHADIRAHPVFYSVCQGIFYVISLRYNEFVESKKGLLFLQGLNFAKIVTCNLNPLKFCHPEIVQNFAVVTRTYQLAYCFTIIENNARMNLPVVHMNEEGLTQGISEKEIFDNFFPFDSYVLKRSSVFISPGYREINTPELKDTFLPKDQTEKSSEEDDDDNDDFLAYDCSNSSAMPIFGVSPNF